MPGQFALGIGWHRPLVSDHDDRRFDLQRAKAACRHRMMYVWVKALHVVAVISWMAGMLYLPRLFVYHCDAETGSRQSETFKVMEPVAPTASMR
jgi:Uncharacterised protein family (UPF0093)